MSDDPSGLAAGVNLLEYVGNSPVGRIDPFGLQWFRPPTEKSVFGRDGTWVEPDGAGQVIADNVPAMHTTSKMHDELLTDVMPILVRIGIPYKTADQMMNYPTMPGTFVQAVIKETERSAKQVITRVRDWLTPDGRQTSCR